VKPLPRTEQACIPLGFTGSDEDGGDPTNIASERSEQSNRAPVPERLNAVAKSNERTERPCASA
jgi:hypothetical protein